MTYEEFVKHLAENGVTDNCRKLQLLIVEGGAEEAVDHVDSWVRKLASEIINLNEKAR